MREHGALERLLLIYEEGVRRLDAHVTVPPEPLSAAAGLVRSFIEDCHQKEEEEDVFPRLEKAGRLTGLTAVLRAQHAAGRSVTDGIQKRLERAPFNDPAKRRELAGLLGAYVRMYWPHYAREDTVVYAAFREVVTPKRFAALGESFAEREQKSSERAGSRRWSSRSGNGSRNSASPTWGSLRRSRPCDRCSHGDTEKRIHGTFRE